MPAPHDGYLYNDNNCNSSGSVHAVGDVCGGTCASGYVPSGSVTIVCMSDGQWSQSNGCVKSTVVCSGECAHGYYYDATQCNTANHGCRPCSGVSCRQYEYQDMNKCTGNQTGCTACSDGNCIDGQFYSFSLCKQLDSGCRQCDQSYCVHGMYYISNKCHSFDTGCRTCSSMWCGPGETFAISKCSGSSNGCLLDSSESALSRSWASAGVPVAIAGVSGGLLALGTWVYFRRKHPRDNTIECSPVDMPEADGDIADSVPPAGVSAIRTCQLESNPLAISTTTTSDRPG